MKRATHIAVLAALTGLCACNQPEHSSSPAKPAATAPARVEVTHPRRGEISRWVSLPGSVRPMQQASLYAKVAGYLKKISVDRGDHVKAGAVIAEIESPELVADTAKYEAELKVAELNLKRLTDASAKAPDLVVPFTVDEARSKLDVAKAALERNRTLLGFSTIVAPFEGIITRRFVDVGALIPAATSGGPQSAAIVTVMDFTSVRVDVPVPEADAPFIRAGLAARVAVDELPNRPFTGTVTRFAYALDDVTKTMIAEVQLPNPQLELRPGMFVTCRIAAQTKTNAFLVPAEALVTEKAKTYVFQVKDGKAAKTPVKVGFQDGSSVEIIEGVASNDTVVLAGKQPPADGQPVQIAGEK